MQASQSSQKRCHLSVGAPHTATEHGNSIDEYQLLHFLGNGSHSSVYEVHCFKCGNNHALKMVDKKTLKKDRLTMMLVNEMDVHKKVQHERVVKLLHCFEDAQYVYLLLELCRNGELRSLLKTQKRVGPAEGKRLFMQIVEGMKYLHDNNILHRDLKLANIMLTEHNDIKIGDFGLAVQLKTPSEERETMCGTPNYISPEILENLPYSFETDVWSLGCILYALLVGSPPFECPQVQDTLIKVKTGFYDLPSDISPSAQDLIRKLLCIDRNKRLTVKQILQHPYLTTPLETSTGSKTSQSVPAGALSSHLESSSIPPVPQPNSAVPIPSKSALNPTSLAQSTLPETAPKATHGTQSTRNQCRAGSSMVTAATTWGGQGKTVKSSIPAVVPTAKPEHNYNSNTEGQAMREEDSKDDQHGPNDSAKTNQNQNQQQKLDGNDEGVDEGCTADTVDPIVMHKDKRKVSQQKLERSVTHEQKQITKSTQHCTPTPNSHSALHPNAAQKRVFQKHQAQVHDQDQDQDQDQEDASNSREDEKQDTQENENHRTDGKENLSGLENVSQSWIKGQKAKQTEKARSSGKEGKTRRLRHDESREEAAVGGQPLRCVNTERLKPFTHNTQHGCIKIEADGHVELEIANRTKLLKIASNGQRIAVCSKLIENCGSEYTLSTLPRKFHAMYRYVYDFVNVLRSKTPKVILQSDDLRCVLMENLPCHNCELKTKDGTKICHQLQSLVMDLSFPDGKHLQLNPYADYDFLSHDLKALLNIFFISLKKCLEVERLADIKATSFPVCITPDTDLHDLFP